MILFYFYLYFISFLAHRRSQISESQINTVAVAKWVRFTSLVHSRVLSVLSCPCPALPSPVMSRPLSVLA